MRSPNALSTLSVVFGLVILAGCTTSGNDQVPGEPVNSDNPHEVDHEHDHELPAEMPPDSEAAAVAAAFATAFADTGSGDGATWLAGLQEHCYTEYCDLLIGVDPAELPTGAAPTGDATVTPGADEASRTATVPASGGAWTVSLFVGTSGEWLVADCRWSPA